MTAAENIALDDVLLGCKANRHSQDTLRFLRFDPHCVLVGYHQSVEHHVREEFCLENGIDINRRITGGGAIYFNKESLGWEIIASKDNDLNQSLFNAGKSYKRMCKGVIAGLKSLGVTAEFKSRNDIEVNGRKISGTGGTDRGNALLFQGTLLIDFDADTMLRSLRVPLEKLQNKEIESVKERVTSLKQVMEEVPSITVIKNALAEGFERTFNIKLFEKGLTSREKKLFDSARHFYESPDWVYGDRTHPEAGTEVYSMKKTNGGLVRITLNLDLQRSKIKNALVTGDFFIFPSRAILNLEEMLRDTSFDSRAVKAVVERFFESRVQIPGVGPDDVIDLIMEAIQKTKYLKYGVYLNEVNCLYSINTDLDSLNRISFDVLLLPYCSKLIDCNLRNKNGCTECGRCTIGTAYELARKHDLKPITIQNYEHLMETIQTIHNEGSQGYIGCCCEGFYMKHRADFESIDLPGILININDQTCYDLGKENEAYKGAFENQTSLRLNLLETVIKKLAPMKDV